MKKFLVFAVCALMSAAAQAISFSFAEVIRVAQAGNAFYAYTAGGEAVAISAYQYTQMKDATGWYILDVDGEKVVAAGDEFVVEKLTADSVGLENSLPKVFFTNGTTKGFTNPEWLKLLKGQEIRRVYINIPTWEFENYATVDKGVTVAYHAPVAPKLPVAKVVAPAPKAESKASEAKADSLPAPKPAPKAEVKVETPAPATATPTSANNGNGGITFKITH